MRAAFIRGQRPEPPEVVQIDSQGVTIAWRDRAFRRISKPITLRNGDVLQATFAAELRL